MIPGFSLIPENLLRQKAAIEEDMISFCRCALAHFPSAAPSYVRTVAEEIVRRAQVIAQSSPTDPHKLAPFLLEVSRRWLYAGNRIEDIGKKLPRDINAVGMLIVEMNLNPHTGAPLTNKDFKAATKLGKLKLQ